jgi:hypothetical protein
VLARSEADPGLSAQQSVAPAGAAIVGIYRQQNADHVARLLEPAREAGWAAAWWALDSRSPLLDDVTVGEGAGLKLPLLNETLRRLGSAAPWTIVSDDDLAFRKGDVVRLVKACENGGLDLAQPARAPGTERSHGITAAIHWSRMRLTTFVESGPIVAIGPRCRDRILPLPDERGMGWGVEIDWFDLARNGCRLGIVDGVLIEHLGRRAEHYDDTEIRRRLLAELESRGHPLWDGMRNTIAVWRPWQRTPPWSAS